MIQFKPDAEWRGAGAPPVEVPQEIADALDRTYATGAIAEDEADETAQETYDVIRLMRLYATRQGKKLDTQFFDRDGRTYLRFRMRDKRKYQKNTTRRTRR